MNRERLRERCEPVLTEVVRVPLGRRPVIDHAWIAILARGHVLLEGVPGLGKTLLVRTLSHLRGPSFKPIQFTPERTCWKPSPASALRGSSPGTSRSEPGNSGSPGFRLDPAGAATARADGRSDLSRAAHQCCEQNETSTGETGTCSPLPGCATLSESHVASTST